MCLDTGYVGTDTHLYCFAMLIDIPSFLFTVIYDGFRENSVLETLVSHYGLLYIDITSCL